MHHNKGIRSTRDHDVEPLADDIRDLVGRLRRRLAAEMAPGQPSLTESGILSTLQRVGPMTQSELARAHGMKPQTLGAVVADLEELGYVSRHRRRHDRRSIEVGLTAAGHRVVAEFRATRNAWLARALANHTTPSERAALAEAVAVLNRLLELPSTETGVAPAQTVRNSY